MKTLIILKGLVKRDKLDWVKKQGLEMFFLDYSDVRNLYSAPELLTPERTVLNFSYSDTVHKRFIEMLCFRMSKGCLIVVDIENLTSSTIETLATIFGYKVFWVIGKIPQDYMKAPQKYSNPLFPLKSKLECKKDILNYNNSINKISGLPRITDYSQITRYWNEKKNITTLEKLHGDILHISDLHSHYEFFNKILPMVDSSELSIFYGDYIDGPVQSGSRSILDAVLGDTRENVVWLEGNHESRLRKYLGSKYFDSLGKSSISETLLRGIPGDFFKTTAKEFDDITGSKALDYIKQMNDKLNIYHVLSSPYKRTEYICTHSGFRYLDQLTPKFIGNVIYGSRNMEKIDKTFSEKVGKPLRKWSIHAHCKYPVWEVDKFENVMNIDPADEYEAIVMTQTTDSWRICKLKNEK